MLGQVNNNISVATHFVMASITIPMMMMMMMGEYFTPLAAPPVPFFVILYLCF
jgi:hypothetical protein